MDARLLRRLEFCFFPKLQLTSTPARRVLCSAAIFTVKKKKKKKEEKERVWFHVFILWNENSRKILQLQILRLRPWHYSSNPRGNPRRNVKEKDTAASAESSPSSVSLYRTNPNPRRRAAVRGRCTLRTVPYGENAVSRSVSERTPGGEVGESEESRGREELGEERGLDGSNWMCTQCLCVFASPHPVRIRRPPSSRPSISLFAVSASIRRLNFTNLKK
jgi:hypothetical protein